MVNMDTVRQRLLRGAYVGVGSFLSGFTARLIEDNLGVGDIGTSVGQVATGLGVSVAVDQVFDNPRSLPNETIEFAGYGIQGAGFANLAESIQTGQTASGNMVSVSTDGGSSQTGQNVQVVEEDNQGNMTQRPFAADVA